MAYYMKDDWLLAALSANRDKDIAEIALCLQRDYLPSPKQLRTLAFDWAAWLA